MRIPASGVASGNVFAVPEGLSFEKAALAEPLSCVMNGQERVGLAMKSDVPITVAACELVLESLVARRKISRNDQGRYGRAQQESRRRPSQDMFGGGLSA